MAGVLGFSKRAVPMPDFSWEDEVARGVPTLQIIVGSMVLGCLFLLAVPVFLAPQPMQPVGQELITWVAVGFAGIMSVARLVILPVLARHARRGVLRSTLQSLPTPAPKSFGGRMPQSGSPDEEVAQAGVEVRLLPAFHVRTILGAAMFEGCALVALVCCMVERSPVALGLAIALILGVAGHVPTRSRVVRWIEEQRELLQQERMRGDF